MFTSALFIDSLFATWWQHQPQSPRQVVRRQQLVRALWLAVNVAATQTGHVSVRRSERSHFSQDLRFIILCWTERHLPSSKTDFKMLVPLKWETGFDCRGDESMYIMTLDEKGLGLRENYRALEVLLLILWTNVFSAHRCQEIAEVQFLQTVNHWTICWCHSCMETVRWRHKSRGRCQRLPGFGPRTQQHRYSRLPTVSLPPDSSFSLTPAVVSPVNRCQDMFQPHRRHLAIIWRETDMKLGW